jgi:hypothetical protein
MTKYETNKTLSLEDIASEFGELTNNNGMTRRQAMAAMARRHGIQTNRIYAALEKLKK